jgi:hypothetical protein
MKGFSLWKAFFFGCQCAGCGPTCALSPLLVFLFQSGEAPALPATTWRGSAFCLASGVFNLSRVSVQLVRYLTALSVGWKPCSSRNGAEPRSISQFTQTSVKMDRKIISRRKNIPIHQRLCLLFGSRMMRIDGISRNFGFGLQKGRSCR